MFYTTQKHYKTKNVYLSVVLSDKRSAFVGYVSTLKNKKSLKANNSSTICRIGIHTYTYWYIHLYCNVKAILYFFHQIDMNITNCGEPETEYNIYKSIADEIKIPTTRRYAYRWFLMVTRRYLYV